MLCKAYYLNILNCFLVDLFDLVQNLYFEEVQSCDGCNSFFKINIKNESIITKKFKVSKINYLYLLPDDFDEMRNKGENDSFICKLIREDSVEDFIAYVNKNCISPNANINPSIYETNPFLLFHLSKPLGRVTLIEYAAFFGSIQIFKYLKDAKAELIPYLHIFGIHSNNAELINYLDEHFIEPNTTNEKVESLFKELFYESFKCHHNEIAIYFINKCLQNQYENSKAVFIQSLKYYNFSFLQNELVNESSFCYLCNFDYYSLVKYLLTIRGADVNSKTI